MVCLLFFQLMDLKGQMIYVSESNAILFLGSPCVDKLEELTGRGLYLSDIPIHNALRDVVLVGEQAKAQDGLKKRLGKAKAALEHAHQALEEEKKKTVDLLFSIFPGTVAQQLWQGQTVQAKKFERVTMLFSDIVGFTAVCSRCTPMQVITMLNELYTRFDHHCGELDVYKVCWRNTEKTHWEKILFLLAAATVTKLVNKCSSGFHYILNVASYRLVSFLFLKKCFVTIKDSDSVCEVNFKILYSSIANHYAAVN